MKKSEILQQKLVTNAFRLRGLAGHSDYMEMPVSRRCHQCLSAEGVSRTGRPTLSTPTLRVVTNAFRLRGLAGPAEDSLARFDSRSPMPFG